LSLLSLLLIFRQPPQAEKKYKNIQHDQRKELESRILGKEPITLQLCRDSGIIHIAIANQISEIDPCPQKSTTAPVTGPLKVSTSCSFCKAITQSSKGMSKYCNTHKSAISWKGMMTIPKNIMPPGRNGCLSDFRSFSMHQ
jgi:hypothetical protein